MNYGDLKSHFNDLLNRSDITLDTDDEVHRPGDRSCTTSTSDPNVRACPQFTITSQTARNDTSPPISWKSFRSTLANTNSNRVSMRKYREIANTAV